MATFKIGDRVRMLRSSEEGIVVKIKGDFIDIETTDGFELPTMASELVIVAEAEKEYFNVSETKKSEEVMERIIERNRVYKKQVSIAFEQINDFLLRPYFINETSKEISFVLSLSKNGEFLNFVTGNCASESETRIYEDLKKEDFENWSKWKMDLVFFEKEKLNEPLRTIEFKLKATNLFKNKTDFPFSERTGFLRTISLAPKEDQVESPKPENPFYDVYAFNKTEIFDLHAEKLEIQSDNPDVIFNKQKSYFTKKIDSAVADSLVELTVIHGVGNGHLKNFIHKHLASHEQVEWFKEAQKEKFGYGATLVHFKP
ncbi:Smr/MutS family protein [uncultured Arcticibacterium sp.]|uniref:Smr/MutS family protein n=1 Tax=uncultured Arcticibacterium sp. TaxID=2173042 RepID=UPI0030F8BCC0